MSNYTEALNKAAYKLSDAELYRALAVIVETVQEYIGEHGGYWATMPYSRCPSLKDIILDVVGERRINDMDKLKMEAQSDN